MRAVEQIQIIKRHNSSSQSYLIAFTTTAATTVILPVYLPNSNWVSIFLHSHPTFHTSPSSINPIHQV